MTKPKLFLFVTILGFFLGCQKSEFQQQYSFTLDGTDYDFSDFITKTDWLESQNRLFVSKEDGNNVFNINFPLDLPNGKNGMEYRYLQPAENAKISAWFYIRISAGDFYTLDESTSTINVIEIDTLARTISATFSGVGSQAISDETVSFSNGVLKLEY
jgi:hypothetical protein